MIENVEYAIEIPDRGFYDPWTGNVCTHGPLHPYENIDGTIEGLKMLKAKFASMGISDISQTARIVSRTATLTYSEWDAIQ